MTSRSARTDLEGYERTWDFQLLVCATTRLPFLVVALVAVLWSRSVLGRSGPRPSRRAR